MAGFGQNELFEFDLDPGELKTVTGHAGQIHGQPLQKFAGKSPGFGLQNLAEGMIVDRFAQIIPGGRTGQRGYGKDGGAENGLAFAALGIRHAEVAGELEIDEGKRGGHGRKEVLGRGLNQGGTGAAEQGEKDEGGFREREGGDVGLAAGAESVAVETFSEHEVHAVPSHQNRQKAGD